MQNQPIPLVNNESNKWIATTLWFIPAGANMVEMDDHDNNNNNHREEEGCYHYHQTIIRIFYQNLDVFCYFEMMLIPIEKRVVS